MTNKNSIDFYKLLIIIPCFLFISIFSFFLFGLVNVKAYQVLPTGVYFNGISHGYDADRLYIPNSDTTFVNFDLGEHAGNFKIDVVANYRVNVAHLIDNSVNLSSFNGVVHFGTEVVNMSKSCNIIDQDLYFGTVNCYYSLTYFKDTSTYVIIQLQNSPNVFGTDLGGEKSSIKPSVRVFVKPLSDFEIGDTISGGNQDIINNNNGNTQEIINNQDKNSQDIINNQDKNSQDIINNQDKLNKDTYYDCIDLPGNYLTSYKDYINPARRKVLEYYGNLNGLDKNNSYLYINKNWLSHFLNQGLSFNALGPVLYILNDDGTTTKVSDIYKKYTYNHLYNIYSLSDLPSDKFVIKFFTQDISFDYTNNSIFDLNNVAMVLDKPNYNGDDFFPVGSPPTNECKNKIDKTNDQLEEQNKTSKGILETLINLPRTLIDLFTDMLKSVFIPSDDFFSNKFDELTELVENKMGVLAYPFTITIETFDFLLNFEDDGNYIIEWNDITVPNFDYVIIKAGSFNLSSTLENSWINLAHDLYMTFVSAYLLLSFLKFCNNKYSDMFGGDFDDTEYMIVEESVTDAYTNPETGVTTYFKRSERRRKEVDDE